MTEIKSPQPDDEMRAAFEAKFGKHQKWCDPDVVALLSQPLCETLVGKYIFNDIQKAWEAWQAGIQHVADEALADASEALERLDQKLSERAARAIPAPEGALTEEDRTRALNLAYQFRSHPASRGIDDIEQAGETILALLAALAAQSANADPVAEVVSSGPANFPLLRWLSADISLNTPIGAKLYTHPAPAAPVALTKAQVDACWDGLIPSGCGKSKYDIAAALVSEAQASIQAPAEVDGDDPQAILKAALAIMPNTAEIRSEEQAEDIVAVWRAALASKPQPKRKAAGKDYNPKCEKRGGTCNCDYAPCYVDGSFAPLPAGSDTSPPKAAIPSPAVAHEPLHLGACLTDGKLHATVMRREPKGHITVVATAEIDESMLRAHDCHAVMRPDVVSTLRSQRQLIGELVEALHFFVEHPGVRQLCTSDSKVMESARSAINKAVTGTRSNS